MLTECIIIFLGVVLGAMIFILIILAVEGLVE